jgi:phosphatidylserine decarboxylase
MRPNTRYETDLPKKITVTNTNTGKKVEVEVANMNDTSITIYLANEKIVLYKKGSNYIGNKFGMELVYTASNK